MQAKPTTRRTFLRAAAMATTASALPLLAEPADNWQRTWQSAITTLTGNVRRVPHFADPILFEGSTYQGAWQECGPHESLVYASLRQYIPAAENRPAPLEVSRNTHNAFFKLQREDGQLPAAVKMSDIGFGQIQMVVPIAATAWDLAQQLSLEHDSKAEKFLRTAYISCGRWDAWLRRYRNTRNTGLVEAFCTYDTGQDNSPRWAGIPNRCPDADARKFPPLASMPRLCPDLSATVFGARMALASMAHALGKRSEADRWLQDAETIRELILTKLWCEEDASFYDLDAQNNFVRVRSVANCRVPGEHVLRLDNKRERAIFDTLWTKQLHNSKAFWAPYPLTSIAQDDPKFVRPIPRNSWGGASQALTALRTLRWMPHYGKTAEHRYLMQQWAKAILRHGEFRQQLDPQTGTFTQPDPGGYSPAALVFLTFARELGHAPSI